MKEKKPKKQAAGEASPKEHKANWKEYTATVDDIRWFLADHILLRRNVVLDQVEYRIPEGDLFAKKLNLPETKEWQPISDYVVNSLWTALSQEKKVRAQDIYRVIDSDHVPDFNPFAYYLEHLPPWDGENHILALSMSVMMKNVEEQMRFYEYLRKWLVGMVAGWLSEEAVNDVVLVLIGRQGIYKTTWFNHLLPPELQPYFHTKLNASSLTRDDRLMLTQAGLICLEELDTMRPTELNQLKSAITARHINERAAYAHYHQRRPHIASFCGTGNNLQFLTDPTGNRRWLPFEVESITSPRDRPFDYEHIYAEAYALYKQHFQYWFSREEVEELAGHNRQFETPRLETELVQQYFRVPGPREPGEFMPVSLALQIVGLNITQKLSNVWLGRAFKELGFRDKTKENVRGYIVVRRSPEEQHALRRMMALEADDDIQHTVNTV